METNEHILSKYELCLYTTDIQDVNVGILLEGKIHSFFIPRYDIEIKSEPDAILVDETLLEGCKMSESLELKLINHFKIVKTMLNFAKYMCLDTSYTGNWQDYLRHFIGAIKAIQDDTWYYDWNDNSIGRRYSYHDNPKDYRGINQITTPGNHNPMYMNNKAEWIQFCIQIWELEMD